MDQEGLTRVNYFYDYPLTLLFFGIKKIIKLRRTQEDYYEGVDEEFEGLLCLVSVESQIVAKCRKCCSSKLCFAPNCDQCKLRCPTTLCDPCR